MLLGKDKLRAQLAEALARNSELTAEVARLETRLRAHRERLALWLMDDPDFKAAYRSAVDAVDVADPHRAMEGKEHRRGI